MTIILFIFDLLDAILMCMSRTTMDNPYLCDFQGIAITTLEVGNADHCVSVQGWMEKWNGHFTLSLP